MNVMGEELLEEMHRGTCKSRWMNCLLRSFTSLTLKRENNFGENHHVIVSFSFTTLGASMKKVILIVPMDTATLITLLV